MSKGIKIFWGIVVVAIIIIIIAISRTPKISTLSNREMPESSIAVGVIIPLSGDNAVYGIPLRHAAEMAIEEINARGGIANREIKAIWEDGKCEASTAAAAAQKLINLDFVKFIFGGACSSETLAIAPLAEIAKVIVISPSATSPGITNAGDFVFRTAPSDANAGMAAADYAYDKMEARKAAVISETKDYAQGLRQTFKNTFTAIGGEIVADETYNTSDTDMRAQALKIKAGNPDVIYLAPQTSASGILILKQLAADGMKVGLLTTEVMMNSDVADKNANDMEGLVGIGQLFDEKNETTASMFTRYAEKYGEESAIPSFQANMYSQFYLLKEAIEKVGTNTEKVRDYFYGLKNWEHALGSLTFDASGDPIGFSYSIKKIENGKFVDAGVFTPGD